MSSYIMIYVWPVAELIKKRFLKLKTVKIFPQNRYRFACYTILFRSIAQLPTSSLSL